MSGANYSKQTRSGGQGSAALWNILSLLMVLGALCLGVYFGLIYLMPQTGLNPFPRPTDLVIAVLPSPTATSLNQLPPTWTPTATILPTETATPRPSSTPEFTATAFILPTWTNTPTPTATTPPRYELRDGEPDYMDASKVVDNRSCDWMGVGGRVLGADGDGVDGLKVVLGGEYESKAINKSATTGSAEDYGTGGFEIQIADGPNNSKETLYVQLFDKAGNALSDRFYFRTYDDCGRNLIRFTFILEQ
jgi:hypothetical protein